MEEGDNFLVNITNEPSDSVGICGLNATLIKEYVRYGLETLYLEPYCTGRLDRMPQRKVREAKQ